MAWSSRTKHPNLKTFCASCCSSTTGFYGVDDDMTWRVAFFTLQTAYSRIRIPLKRSLALRYHSSQLHSQDSSVAMDSIPLQPTTVKFNERWKLLKPCLERLYFDQKRKLPEIVQIMKAQYGFNAVWVSISDLVRLYLLTWNSDSQYKYHFKLWGWMKNIS